MTAKEKAKELFDKFYKCIPQLDYTDSFTNEGIHAKQCALILVQEIIYELVTIAINQDDFFSKEEIKLKPRMDYWKQVKQEIENIKTT